MKSQVLVLIRKEIQEGINSDEIEGSLILRRNVGAEAKTSKWGLRHHFSLGSSQSTFIYECTGQSYIEVKMN